MAEMTDTQLIGYCEIHCETERALFSGHHINRMIDLAGFPEDFPAAVGPDTFLSAHEEMAELCKLARERAKSSPATTEKEKT
jgi:hypothetical protein